MPAQGRLQVHSKLQENAYCLLAQRWDSLSLMLNALYQSESPGRSHAVYIANAYLVQYIGAQASQHADAVPDLVTTTGRLRIYT